MKRSSSATPSRKRTARTTTIAGRCPTTVVRAGFGGRVVAVNKRQVWGAGSNDLAALADAQAKPECPGLYMLTFATVPSGGAKVLAEPEWPVQASA